MTRKSLSKVKEEAEKWENTFGRPLLGSLSNDDINENGKKAIGLDWQNNNFARASRFFVHFFAVTARLRHEDAYFHVKWRTRTQDHGFLFLILNFRYSFLEFNSRKNCQYLTN